MLLGFFFKNIILLLVSSLPGAVNATTAGLSTLAVAIKTTSQQFELLSRR